MIDIGELLKERGVDPFKDADPVAVEIAKILTAPAMSVVTMMVLTEKLVPEIFETLFHIAIIDALKLYPEAKEFLAKKASERK